MNNYRITDKAVVEFATELGFRAQGRSGSRTIVTGDGHRTLHGPCSNRENMAYLRGVRDVWDAWAPEKRVDTVA